MSLILKTNIYIYVNCTLVSQCLWSASLEAPCSVSLYSSCVERMCCGKTLKICALSPLRTCESSKLLRRAILLCTSVRFWEIITYCRPLSLPVFWCWAVGPVPISYLISFDSYLSAAILSYSCSCSYSSPKRLFF